MKAKLGILLPIYGGWLGPRLGIKNSLNEEREVTYEYTEKVALKAEEIGIDSVWVADHLLNPIKGEKAKCLEAWTTLTAIASVTEKIELFHTCICEAFRYPAVLAKMCSTLWDISKSRFKLILGAGWYKREFEAYGIPWHEHDDRIERGGEQIEIIKKFCSEPNFNYKGRFYEIVDGVMEPKPEKMPEIWWAGESEKSRILTANLADGWLMYGADIPKMIEKINDMKSRLKKNRDKPFKYAMPGYTVIEESDEKALARLSALVRGDTNALNKLRGAGFIGSPETVVEKVKKLEDIGLDYILFQIPDSLEQLKTIEKEIMPCL